MGSGNASIYKPVGQVTYSLHTGGVTGSIPVAPTIRPLISLSFSPPCSYRVAEAMSYLGTGQHHNPGKIRGAA